MPQVIRSLSARSYLLFFAVLVTTALLLGTTDSFSASSLKVISPNGGQSYAVGQSVKIKWAKGNGGSQVKVTLLKGGKGYLVIQKKTKNDGKLTWKVSSKVKAGSNYKIKIQSLSDTKVSDTSNKPFKITKAKDTKAKDTKTATFKVTQPKRGKKYKTGKNMAIRWHKGSGTYVKITLLKGTKTDKVIHKKTKNDGKHTYTIPSTIKAGKTYKVKICSTKSTKSCATSKAFTIAKGTATTIKVTYPNGAEELEQGSTHVIKWNKGNGGKFVKIQLTRVVKGKDKGFRYLAKKTKNTGKYSWKIPTTNKYPVGSKYKIKVMAFKGGNKINDLSDKTFSIVKASSGGSTGGNTGGGSAGGGNTGGGATGGGHDGDATVDDSTGPPETDDGGDVESTIRITSPSPGQEIEKGEAFDISWEATGAARDMDICLEFIRPNGDYSLGWVHPSDEPRTSTIGFRKNGPMPEGEWTVLVSALFEGDRCSATVDNFCSECDNPRSEINFNIAGHTHSVSGSGGNSECANLILSGKRLKVDESGAFVATDVSFAGDCSYPDTSISAGHTHSVSGSGGNSECANLILSGKRLKVDESGAFVATDVSFAGDCSYPDTSISAGHTHSVSGSGGNSECANLILSGKRLKVDESGAFVATDVSFAGDCSYPGMSGPKY